MHGNYYLTVSSFADVYYFIKLFISKFAFYKQLEKSSDKFLLLDFFINKFAFLVKKIILTNYISNL